MKKKILVMDDSATARALFRACFMYFPDYEIIEAKQVDEAIEKAERHKPILIVLDYNMPEYTGSEVAKKMRAKGIEIPFVLLTANTQQSVIEEATELDFLDVLEKPVSMESIRLLLEKIQ